MSLSGPAEWMSTNGVVAADAAGTAMQRHRHRAGDQPGDTPGRPPTRCHNFTPNPANDLSYGFFAR